jgi:hypothetical protein
MGVDALDWLTTMGLGMGEESQNRLLGLAASHDGKRFGRGDLSSASRHIKAVSCAKPHLATNSGQVLDQGSFHVAAGRLGAARDVNSRLASSCGSARSNDALNWEILNARQ